MSDLTHRWGGDLLLSPTGDLALSDAPSVTQQRVLRRLLTNPGEYLWSLEYGAGLGGYVGRPGAASAIRAAVRSQIFKEAAIGHVPEPVIDLVPDVSGMLYLHIRYADAATGTTQVLTTQVLTLAP